MRYAATIVSAVIALQVVARAAEELKSSAEDNTIIARVLEASSRGGDGTYTVVEPETQIRHSGLRSRGEIEKFQRFISDGLKVEGVDIGPLVTRFLERNRKPAKLTLESAPEKGYLVDRDGKFTAYFRDEGGGWEKWYKENPKARGMTSVSLPAYDKELGIVLIYKGTQVHWLNGAGYVIAYRFDGKTLKELGRVMLWVS
jgi:hypothetical protein